MLQILEFGCLVHRLQTVPIEFGLLAFTPKLLSTDEAAIDIHRGQAHTALLLLIEVEEVLRDLTQVWTFFDYFTTPFNFLPLCLEKM